MLASPRRGSGANYVHEFVLHLTQTYDGMVPECRRSPYSIRCDWNRFFRRCALVTGTGHTMYGGFRVRRIEFVCSQL